MPSSERIYALFQKLSLAKLAKYQILLPHISAHWFWDPELAFLTCWRNHFECPCNIHTCQIKTTNLALIKSMIDSTNPIRWWNMIFFSRCTKTCFQASSQVAEGLPFSKPPGWLNQSVQDESFKGGSIWQKGFAQGFVGSKYGLTQFKLKCLGASWVMDDERYQKCLKTVAHIQNGLLKWHKPLHRQHWREKLQKQKLKTLVSLLSQFGQGAPAAPVGSEYWTKPQPTKP